MSKIDNKKFSHIKSFSKRAEISDEIIKVAVVGNFDFAEKGKPSDLFIMYYLLFKMMDKKELGRLNSQFVKYKACWNGSEIEQVTELEKLIEVVKINRPSI